MRLELITKNIIENKFNCCPDDDLEKPCGMFCNPSDDNCCPMPCRPICFPVEKEFNFDKDSCNNSDKKEKETTKSDNKDNSTK